MVEYLGDGVIAYEKTVITKAFTTEPRHHRKSSIDIHGRGSVVFEKCRQLTDLAIRKYPDGNVPDSQLTLWLMEYCGGDKATLRAYKGYEGYIQRSRCGEGRIIGERSRGYLEKFGFMRRMNRSMWRVSQTFLPAYPSSLSSEGSSVSKAKISLFSLVGSEDSLADDFRGSARKDTFSREAKEKEEEYRERERNFLHRFSKDSRLTEEENAILGARPNDEQGSSTSEGGGA